MLTSLVLTITGHDRPGLVEVLSRAIADHHGNWLESRMARLAGQFAGILRLQIPAQQVPALTQALDALQQQGLIVQVIDAGEAGEVLAWRPLTLELLGHDRPGIIRDISHALASRGINIEGLESQCISASMSGETLLQAQVQLRLPTTVDSDELRTCLEGLADELMVDITFQESGETSQIS